MKTIAAEIDRIQSEKMTSKLITNWLKENDKSLNWLAQKIDMSPKLLQVCMEDNIWNSHILVRLIKLGVIKDK